MSDQTGYEVFEVDIRTLSPDILNANAGTERGRELIAESLRNYGAGRSIVVDRHGVVIAGNKTLERALEQGAQTIKIVRVRGNRLVAVRRVDLAIDDPEARELAIADNRATEVDLQWDAQLLRRLQEDFDVDLDEWWFESELQRLYAAQNIDTESQAEQIARLMQDGTAGAQEAYTATAGSGDATNSANPTENPTENLITADSGGFSAAARTELQQAAIAQEKAANADDPDEPEETTQANQQPARPATAIADVKGIQLFFSGREYDELTAKIERLQNAYGKPNKTATVLDVIARQYELHKGTQPAEGQATNA